MSIIKTTNKFQGNSLEKNEQRIDMIEKIKDDDNLPTIIKKFFEYISKHDLDKIKHIIEDELFFEIVPSNIIDRYINKINIYENIEDEFEEVYKLKGQNGFRRTVDCLIRRMP
ncbi:hypothetical protein QIW52_17975 [Clostridioides difficile]|nr:hypothetical protein [Clostridioides difficile]